MSDGPHRSLPMSIRWRRLALRADKGAFDISQVTDGLGPALKGDWQAEGCDELMIAVRSLAGTDVQTSIFESHVIVELETLCRSMAVGSPFRRQLIEHVIYAAKIGGFGSDAVLQGTENALRAQAAKGRFQIEEHYARESTDRRAAHVGRRLDDAMSRCDLRSLARELNGYAPKSTPVRPMRYQGLEDGVSLR